MLGLFTNNMFREPVLSDAELREKGIVLLPQPRQVAPFALVGDDGQPFTEASLAGGWTLAYFGFPPALISAPLPFPYWPRVDVVFRPRAPRIFAVYWSA